MKKENGIKEKWTHMNNKMNKALKFIGIIGVVLVAISLIVAFLGFIMNRRIFFILVFLF